jgi:hypothetical protein
MTSISPFNGNAKIDNIYIRNPENKAKNLKTGPISDANKKMVSAVAKNKFAIMKESAKEAPSPGMIGKLTSLIGGFLPSQEKIGQTAGECAANTYGRPAVTNGIYNLISYFTPQPESSTWGTLWNGSKKLCGEAVRVGIDNSITPHIMPLVTFAAGNTGVWALSTTLSAAQFAFVYFTNTNSQADTDSSYLQEKDFKSLENFISLNPETNEYILASTKEILSDSDVEQYCRLVSTCNLCARLLHVERQDIKNTFKDYVLERSDGSSVLQDGYVLNEQELADIHVLIKALKSNNSINISHEDLQKTIELIGKHNIQILGFTKKQRSKAVPEKFLNHENLNAMVELFTKQVITTFPRNQPPIHSLRSSGKIIDSNYLPRIYEAIDLLLSLKSAVDSSRLLPKQLDLLLTAKATEKDLNEIKEQLDISVEGTLSLQNLQLIYNELDLKDSVNPDTSTEFDEDWIDLKADLKADLNKPPRPLDARLNHNTAVDMEKGAVTIEELEI